MINYKVVKQILFVIGGFLCYMMADGCTFSIGILYTEFLQIFHQSKASTAVLPGLIYAIPQFFGLLVCPLIDTIGSSHGAIIGGFILSISFFVSRYVTNLSVMYITLGVFASLGLEMTYVSSIMTVTKGFVEGQYLGLALGITVSGSGVGVFLFNPLLNYLINEFHWTGAMILESAIFLNIVVAGCLFKLAFNIGLPTIEQSTTIPKIHIEVVTNQDQSIIEQISHSAEALDITNDSRISTEKEGSHTLPRRHLSIVDERRSSVYLSKTQSNKCEPFYKPISHQNKSSSLERRLNAGDNFAVQLPVDEHAASFLHRLSLYNSQNIKDSSQNIQGLHNVSRQSLSVQSIQSVSNNDKVAPTDNDHLQINCDVQPLTDDNDIPISKCTLFRRDLLRSVRSLFSIKVWANKSLLLFYFTTLLFSMSVVVVWTFSYNTSINLGITDSNAAFLMSFTGLGSCLGQVFFGYLSDFVPSISLYAFGCCIAGLITIIIQYIKSYWWLATLHLLFGFCQGVSYTLFSVILVHYASMELYPASLAIYLLFSGSGNLIGTTVAGYMSDTTGSYSLAYITGGSVLITCGICVLPLICTWHRDI